MLAYRSLSVTLLQTNHRSEKRSQINWPISVIFVNAWAYDLLRNFWYIITVTSTLFTLQVCSGLHSWVFLYLNILWPIAQCMAERDVHIPILFESSPLCFQLNKLFFCYESRTSVVLLVKYISPKLNVTWKFFSSQFVRMGFWEHYCTNKFEVVFIVTVCHSYHEIRVKQLNMLHLAKNIQYL